VKEQDLQVFKKLKTEEEKVTLAYIRNGFPGCGNHRHEACVELVEEAQRTSFVKHIGKLLLCPDDKELEECMKILFRFDNWTFQHDTKFADTVSSFRDDWLENYATALGDDWKKSDIDLKKKFKKYLKSSTQKMSSTALTNLFWIVTIPPSSYAKMFLILTGRVLEHPDGVRFKPPHSPNSMTSLMTIPIDLLDKLLQSVIDREDTMAGIYEQAKKLKNVDRCRDEMKRICALYDGDANCSEWSDIIERWPSMATECLKHDFFEKLAKGARPDHGW
jgi:hypothetical protein